MKKLLAATSISLIAFAGIAPAAQAAGHTGGHGYGKVVQHCLQDTTVGGAIQAGKDAHPGAKMTAKTIALSVHCAS